MIVQNSLALVLFLGSVSAIAAPNREIAKINNSAISLEEFNKKYDDASKFYAINPPSKKDVLNDLVNRELGIQEARSMQLDKDPEVMDKLNTVLFHALLEKKLSKTIETIHISDADAKDFYEKNPEIRTSHIFIGVAPNPTPEQDKAALQQIQSIRDKYLNKGMSFSEVAQRHSEGAAAPMGGDLDYLSRDQLDPKYYEAAHNLKKPGAVSDIVKTRFGYHIIRLTAIKPWEQCDKAKVKRMVFEVKRQQVFQAYMSELRKKSKVAVNNQLAE